MKRPARIYVHSQPSWLALAPFAALFVLLMLFAVGGMLVIAREADRSDAARARDAVAQTFHGMQSRLNAAVEMNAAAPPIAGSLSSPSATPASAYGYLNFTDSSALGYYGTIVLNHDGSAFAGTRFGLPWAHKALTAAAHVVAPIAARLPAEGTGTVQALVRDSSGQALAIAVANVAPETPHAIGDAAEAPRRLAMLAPVDLQIVPKMLPSLGVQNFRIIAASPDENAVTIAVEHGAPIVFAWRPRTPGRSAIARWAPAIGALLLVSLIMLALAGRGNIEAMRALNHLAHHDSLTELPNRCAFRNELDRRQARGDPVALGILDLNGFKAVNDEHGHLVGDELLQAVAAEFVRSAGPGDFVARLGGDEFAWISCSLASATCLFERFADRIARPLSVGQLHLQIGASMGVALAYPGITASSLMALADARLYKSKRALRPPPAGRGGDPMPPYTNEIDALT